MYQRLASIPLKSLEMLKSSLFLSQVFAYFLERPLTVYLQ